MEPRGPSSSFSSLLGWVRRDYLLGSPPQCSQQVTKSSSPSVPPLVAPSPAEVMVKSCQPHHQLHHACGHVSVLEPARWPTSARKSMSCWTTSDPSTRTARGMSNRCPSFMCHQHHQKLQDLAVCLVPSCPERRGEPRLVCSHVTVLC